MISALIFDFDGLILDTETPDFEAWDEIYREYGATLDHQRWLAGVGTYGGFDAAEELVVQLGGAATIVNLRAQWATRYRERCEQADLLPGVRDVLVAVQAAHLPAAVASSSDRAWVEGWLAYHGIREYFACIRTRDDVAQVKPAPELFLSAAACLVTPPAECLVFEDSPNGMRAALAAGIRCVAVPIGINQTIALPPFALKLRSLAELPLNEILARVEGVSG